MRFTTYSHMRVRGAEGGEGVRRWMWCDWETVLQARSMVYHASAMEYISSLQVIVALACGWEVGISVHLCRCGVGPRDSWEEFAQTAGTSSKQSAALAFQRCCSLECPCSSASGFWSSPPFLSKTSRPSSSSSSLVLASSSRADNWSKMEVVGPGKY